MNLCGDCHHWSPNNEDSYGGMCKRFPTIHPKSRRDWCGEFKRRGIDGLKITTQDIEDVITANEKRIRQACELRGAADKVCGRCKQCQHHVDGWCRWHGIAFIPQGAWCGKFLGWCNAGFGLDPTGDV